MSGLHRAQLSFAEVLGQSVSAVAPSAVMVTLPALVIPAAGRWTLPVFVVTALLMTAVGYCVGQFSTRMVAVSGLYSYTVKGLGPVPGIGAGWSLLIGYAGAAMASTLGAASYLTALLGRLGVPDGRPTIGADVDDPRGAALGPNIVDRRGVCDRRGRRGADRGVHPHTRRDCRNGECCCHG